MRSIGIAAALAALLALPSLGTIHVKLVEDNTTLDIGQQTCVHIMVMATSGLMSFAGSIVDSPASDPGTLQSVPHSFAWMPPFTEPPPLGLNIWGLAGDNGGWDNFGYSQGFAPDVDFGRNQYAEIASYMVTGVDPGTVTLSYLMHPVAGYKTMEIDKTGSIGSMTPVTIEVLPEPAAMALLAVGGLAVARRRR